MGAGYNKIKIPDVGESGLSKPQTDKILTEMAGGMNYMGATINEHCKTIEKHVNELYGSENYPGIKADVYANKERSIINRKRIWYIFGVLIASGLGAGLTIQVIGI